MKKLSLAIAVLAAAVVSAGPLMHQKSSPNTSQQATPSTIQADYPAPVCPPDCAIPTPSPIPN